jgi:aryl-alcohol dehydrogenase-like predicted oxidoreductase
MVVSLVENQPFVTSAIIGATKIDDLARNITAIDVVLKPAIVTGLESIYQRYPNPGP